MVLRPPKFKILLLVEVSIFVVALLVVPVNISATPVKFDLHKDILIAVPEESIFGVKITDVLLIIDVFTVDIFTGIPVLPIFIEVAFVVPNASVVAESKDVPVILYVPISKLAVAVP